MVSLLQNFSIKRFNDLLQFTQRPGNSLRIFVSLANDHSLFPPLRRKDGENLLHRQMKIESTGERAIGMASLQSPLTSVSSIPSFVAHFLPFFAKANRLLVLLPTHIYE